MKTLNYKSITPEVFDIEFKNNEAHVTAYDQKVILDRNDVVSIINKYNGWLSIKVNNALFFSFNGEEALQMVECMCEYFRIGRH